MQSLRQQPRVRRPQAPPRHLRARCPKTVHGLFTRRHLLLAANRIPFPFNNFTCCFTLFSKCFSSFHHCTCSLSVSRQYLALDGIYHPLGAAFPNNSTRQKGLTASAGIPRGSHPPGRPVPRDLDTAFHTDSNLQSTTRAAKHDFKSELLPLHSPLLRQSLLVSFPPLIDMLKFSGYSYLI